jgi:hypothetical protein
MDAGQAVANSHSLKRSSHWDSICTKFKQANPYCFACGPHLTYPTNCIQVHHEIPFHFCVLLGRPDLELDTRNLITLCQSESRELDLPDHHLYVGHEGDFRIYNPNVRRDCKRSLISKLFRPFFRKKPKSWINMTDADKKALRALMDRRFPVKS